MAGPAVAAAATLICLVLAELGVRTLVAVTTSPTLAAVGRRIDHGWPLSSEGWAYRFLEAHEAGDDLMRDPLYVTHPTRGWASAPNVRMWRGEYLYTTNRYGHRGPSTPTAETGKTKVMVLGDSQTFGDEVDDQFVWPNILGRQRPDLQVINLAVGGYGLDQMYVTFTEEVDRWDPDVVVISLVPDDLYRSALWFRDYSKPYFAADQAADGTLRDLAYNAPVLERAELARQLRSDGGVAVRRSALASLVLHAFDMQVAVRRNWSRAGVINRELVRRVMTRSARSGFSVVLVFIGDLGRRGGQRDTSDPAEKQYWEICDSLSAAGLECADWRTVAGSRGEFKPAGHYKRLGNELIADLVESALDEGSIRRDQLPDS